MIKLLPYEVWRDIKGYEGQYCISARGRVKSINRIVKRTINGFESDFNLKSRFLKINISSGGYPEATLSNKSVSNKKFRIHRLIAEHFIDNPENKTDINHIDGDKTNFSPNNLEWCTRSENIKHAYDTGLHPSIKGSKQNYSKPIIQMSKDGLFIKEWRCMYDIVKSLQINSTALYQALADPINWSAYGYRWRYKYPDIHKSFKKKKASKDKRCKLTIDDAKRIKSLFKNNHRSAVEIAILFNVHVTTIYNILNNKTEKYSKVEVEAA